MKQIEIQVIDELVAFYSYYLEHGIDVALRKKAVEIEGRYQNASALMCNEVNHAVGLLVDFYAPTGIAPPTKEEAKKILEKLKELQKKLGTK